MNLKSQGRDHGKAWEAIVKQRAQLNGLYPEIQGLRARVMGFNGQLRALESDLDFKIIAPNGITGFFDAKTFDSKRLTLSMLTEHQVKRALLYNHWKVPAGFIVYFRPVNVVSYFSGIAISKLSAGNGYNPDDGMVLGRIESFSLKPLFGLA